jgi:hypothetical protein
MMELAFTLIAIARESHEPHREFTPPRRIRRLAHFWSRAQWRGCSFPTEIALGRGAAIRSDHNVPFRCGPHGRRCKLRLATLRTARDTPLPTALDCRGVGRLLCRARPQRTGARLCLFRG